MGSGLADAYQGILGLQAESITTVLFKGDGVKAELKPAGLIIFFNVHFRTGDGRAPFQGTAIELVQGHLEVTRLGNRLGKYLDITKYPIRGRCKGLATQMIIWI